jgi:hypothetical protein
MNHQKGNKVSVVNITIFAGAVNKPILYHPPDVLLLF